tara:strand:+ start:3322 stop:4461 length:1140 start_codon:yes stop_codon:yes gene_type:complete
MIHSNLGASKAHRWLRCPASVQMESTLPDEVSVYAAEGTAAHTLAEMSLKSQEPPENYIGVEVEGFIVDEVMAYHVAEYVDYCNAISGKKHYELKVDYSKYAAGGFGTADCVVVNKNKVHVIDLKYGSGLKVSAQQNEQLMLYAVGVLLDKNINNVDIVHMTIVQPRLDHVDTYKLAAKDLLEWAENIVAPAAIKTFEMEPEFAPSTKACRFCKAKASCRALAKHNYETTLSNFENLNEPLLVKIPNSLTPHELGLLLPKMEPLISWARGIQEEAKRLLETGGIVDGYKLVAGRNKRAWHDESKAQKVLEDLIGDKAVTKKLISPSQAQKLLGKGRYDEIENLVEKTSGKPSLAPEHDPRPAIKPDATDYFNEINEEKS